MTADTTLAPCPTEQWKCGNELLPYHPSASHVDPAYRDGWNACYAAFRAPAPAPQGPALVPLAGKAVGAIADAAGFFSPVEERAAFISGLRHGEAAHGITGAPNGKPT